MSPVVDEYIYVCWEIFGRGGGTGGWEQWGVGRV